MISIEILETLEVYEPELLRYHPDSQLKLNYFMNQTNKSLKLPLLFQEGHAKRDCPSAPKMTCFKCQEEGHMSRDCPKDGGSGKFSCFKCQEEGHISR